MAQTRHQHPVAVRATTAAQLLDCSRAHVYQLMERGQLRRIQIPGSKAVRIPTEDVYALLGMEPPKTDGAA
jgi:excisionase family DNA binding protein